MDKLSVVSSVEAQDQIIDDFWFRQEGRHSNAQQGRLADFSERKISRRNRRSWLGRLWERYQERKLKERLDQFDRDEIRRYVAQKLFKVDGILCDEQTRILLIDQLLSSSGQMLLRGEGLDDVTRKYGPALAEWALDRVAATVNQPSEILKHATAEYSALKDVDPLLNWHRLKTEDSARTIQRIQDFGDIMAQMVKYSIIIEPGRLRAHLSAYVEEFSELTSIFEDIEFEPQEVEHKAFDQNHITKARNNKLDCVDHSRVVLYLPASLTEPEPDEADLYFSPLIDFETESTKINPKYGTGDFIHANRIAGGPLLNTFICTQAPMLDTICDFWRMIWQEKPENIFMLCDAAEVENFNILGVEEQDHCPFYWPKLMGEEKQFGNLIVRNDHIDSVADPLFTMTRISIWHKDEPDNVHTLDHWQWDWRDYRDFYWPFRLLRRSRLSKRPTVVHCLDGCGRSGTLVFIEVLLMNILRGTVVYEHPGLTCATFVRMQRRHAIANCLQYIYAYRVVLHWIQPFLTNPMTRFSLGLIFEDSGFVTKFDELAQTYARLHNLR